MKHSFNRPKLRKFAARLDGIRGIPGAFADMALRQGKSSGPLYKGRFHHFEAGKNQSSTKHAALIQQSAREMAIDRRIIDILRTEGRVSWKELADPLLQASLDSELIDSAAVATQVPPPGSAARSSASVQRPQRAR